MQRAPIEAVLPYLTLAVALPIFAASFGCTDDAGRPMDTFFGTSGDGDGDPGDGDGDGDPGDGDGAPGDGDGAPGDGDGDPGDGDGAPGDGDGDPGDGDGAPGEECGNAVVEVGEECDLGDANSDDGSCTSECMNATCGDGLVHAGVEDCDDMGESASCNDDCTIAACGDGKLNVLAGEQCDGNQIDNGSCISCAFACDADFDNCNGDFQDGCEVELCGGDCNNAGPFAGMQQFNYTGMSAEFEVPACIDMVTIQAQGAQGGGGNGGNGGTASGTLVVTPGQILTVYVGGQNGYNGGGQGHAFDNRTGGGASDVRTGGTGLNDRVIVAGGGGSSSGDANYAGGAGGGGTCGGNYCGGGGGIGWNNGNGGNGGQNGGTGFSGTHSGGAGGGGLASGGQGSCNTGYTNTCGTNGALGVGGNGDTWENGICFNSYGGTSGGGGGYYGGGGSSVGNCGSGGGGGGSSWVGSLSNTSMTPGNKAGNGTVTISWQP